MSKSIRPYLSGAKSLLVRKPIHELQRLQRWGPRAYFRLEVWKKQMEVAAYLLPPFYPDQTPQQAVEIWFLTGKRFWYQPAFCAWSLARRSGRPLIMNLADDGTLTPELERELRRLFPDGSTHWRQECQAQFEQLLPAARYPTLHLRWHDYINLHKLTAPHLVGSGTKLVLDSDMLFFRRPDALLDWWDQRQNPCLMVDCEESYGYSRPLLERLAGVPLLPSLNVGICGLDSDVIDWDEVEFWCRSLVEAEGTSYYLEQALFAMLASRHHPTVLEKTDYITCPSSNQAEAGGGVLQHYVADSKPSYFAKSWKLLI